MSSIGERLYAQRYVPASCCALPRSSMTSATGVVCVIREMMSQLSTHHQSFSIVEPQDCKRVRLQLFQHGVNFRCGAHMNFFTSFSNFSRYPSASQSTCFTSSSTEMKEEVLRLRPFRGSSWVSTERREEGFRSRAKTFF